MEVVTTPMTRATAMTASPARRPRRLGEDDIKMTVPRYQSNAPQVGGADARLSPGCVVGHGFVVVTVSDTVLTVGPLLMAGLSGLSPTPTARRL